MNGRERFLAAAWRRPADTRPVWLMRQAGRCLPEYRAIRKKVSFLELCANPELACEVTLQPVRRFGVDAAIIFSDILIPVAKMGQNLRFGTGHGPILEPAVRTEEDAKRIHPIDPRVETPEVAQAISLVRSELGDSKAIIGFAGAPFTLLAYMVDGQGSRSFPETKKLLFTKPEVAHHLLGMLSDVLIDYLAMQVDAGADAIQVFDTWAGLLSPRDFDTFAGHYASRVLDGLKDKGVPRTYFPKGVGAYLEHLEQIPCEIIGIDWVQDLGRASTMLSHKFALQGNLDPTALLGSVSALEERTRNLLESTRGVPGHIVNLGHGVLPPTDPERIVHFVDRVHEWGRGMSNPDAN